MLRPDLERQYSALFVDDLTAETEVIKTIIGL